MLVELVASQQLVVTLGAVVNGEDGRPEVRRRWRAPGSVRRRGSRAAQGDVDQSREGDVDPGTGGGAVPDHRDLGVAGGIEAGVADGLFGDLSGIGQRQALVGDVAPQSLQDPAERDLGRDLPGRRPGQALDLDNARAGVFKRPGRTSPGRRPAPPARAA